MNNLTKSEEAEYIQFNLLAFCYITEFSDKYEKVDIVIRPEDIQITSTEEGNVKGKIINCIFKGIHYQYTVKVGKNEVYIQSTSLYDTNIEVGLKVEPDLIHIMKRQISSNVYVGYITNILETIFITFCLHVCNSIKMVSEALSGIFFLF